MIYEYAIHPDFWREIVDKKDLLRSLGIVFGLGKAALIANYPNNTLGILYKNLTAELAQARNPKHQARLQEQKNAVTALQQKFYNNTINRKDTKVWNDSFKQEHTRHTFYAILAPQNKAETDCCHGIEWLRSDNCPLFEHITSTRVQRTANDLTKVLAPLLQNACDITFVDPYFSSITRYTDAYKQYFDCIAKVSHVRKHKINIICSASAGKKPLSEQGFINTCVDISQKTNSKKLDIKVFRIRNIHNRQDIHNRYILTNIGGVVFGHGTDATTDNRLSYDQLALLSAADLAYWQNVYKPDSQDFDWSEPYVLL